MVHPKITLVGVVMANLNDAFQFLYLLLFDDFTLLYKDRVHAVIFVITDMSVKGE